MGMEKEQTPLHFSHDFHFSLLVLHPLLSRTNLTPVTSQPPQKKIKIQKQCHVK